MSDLTIANTVCDLILGDVREHLPLEKIPLEGDVLGLGTTTSVDNGELTFLRNGDQESAIWRCVAHDGSIVRLTPGDGSGHFPYVCFTGDARALRRPVDLEILGDPEGRSLQGLVEDAIAQGQRLGTLEAAPIYGVRLIAHWHELVITVASKLCMGQQRRNLGIASSEAGTTVAGLSLYDMLQHYRLAPQPGVDANDPIRYLGRSMQWDCCGFFDTEPELGRVTVPQEGAHLHLHGCSTDLAYGGHLHHEHPSTRLARLESLWIYPLRSIKALASDLAIESLVYRAGALHFRVSNIGSMDVSDVGVAVVIDDRYSNHRYVRIPWLKAGESEDFTMPLSLPKGDHRISVIADPEQLVIEVEGRRANNRMDLDVVSA
ncbi:CARDB domain-containing protein [Synechococcus sp. W2B2]|uniref:CARDB domain-containing protein n=1 Tax=unclassified Synechococcus TaxID=2626047 RepID=UPI00006B0CA3|nr:CARDB domain-containing protein [Synechococcus sp. WH 7805]EAR18819.1 hypothetical protein WH7805_03252 [Synechococcus sp. WH 7805]